MWIKSLMSFSLISFKQDNSVLSDIYDVIYMICMCNWGTLYQEIYLIVGVLPAKHMIHGYFEVVRQPRGPPASTYIPGYCRNNIINKWIIWTSYCIRILKQNHMVVAYFPWYFTRRPAWKPRPRRGSGFHAGSPSEVSWKICNNKCGFVFIPHLYP